MQRKGLFYGICLFLIATLLAASSVQQRRLDAIRTGEQLVDVAPLKDAPPVVVFTTVALGGFRGLIADYFWLRSQRMQEQGDYYEMYQLANWITNLQPRFTGAISFLAWNMAYNISVTYPSYEDRWRWVQKGIELIRDRGLVNNPGDPELFYQLAWIYQHKLGQEADDANKFYRFKLVSSMVEVFGDYPPVPRDEKSIKANKDWWKSWQEAPVNPADVLPPELPLETVLKQANIATPEALRDSFRGANKLPDAVKDALKDRPDLRKGLEKSLRKTWLAEIYKLDISYMVDLNKKYGELDWRLPEAHAIYWSSKGLEKARGNANLFCNRCVFQSLNSAFKNGRITAIVGTKDVEGRVLPQLLMAPNLGCVDVLSGLYENAEMYFGKEVIRAGRENFYKDAAVLLYTYGYQKKAKDYYKKLQDYQKVAYPGDKDRIIAYSKDIEEFILNEVVGDMGNASNAVASYIINGYFQQAWTAYLFDEDNGAHGTTLLVLAATLHKNYTRDIGKQTQERRGLPPFIKMKEHSLVGFYRSLPEGSEYRDLLEQNATGGKDEMNKIIARVEKEDKEEEERAKIEAAKRSTAAGAGGKAAPGATQP